jgi:hypothetical protein
MQGYERPEEYFAFFDRNHLIANPPPRNLDDEALDLRPAHQQTFYTQESSVGVNSSDN